MFLHAMVRESLAQEGEAWLRQLAMDPGVFRSPISRYAARVSGIKDPTDCKAFIAALRVAVKWPDSSREGRAPSRPATGDRLRDTVQRAHPREPTRKHLAAQESP